MDSTCKLPSLITLLFMVSLASVSAVLFTPALPLLSSQIGIDTAQAQLTISIFVVGYSIGNLFYGPLSNRYGRKVALYIGLLIALVGEGLCVIAGIVSSFPLLLSARFLSAIGCCSGFTIAFTIAGDVYEKKPLSQKLSYFQLMFGLAPGIAIVLGGFLTQSFGWQGCLYFLLLYTLFIVVLSYFLPETLKEKDLNALKSKTVVRGYLVKLSNPRILLSSLMMGSAISVVYLFASEAPFIAIEKLGFTPKEFGLWNFIPPAGLVAGSLFSNYLVPKTNQITRLTIGIGILAVSSMVMLISFWYFPLSIFLLFIPIPFIYAGVSLTIGTCSSIAISHSRNKANGSAIMSFLSLGTCVCILWITQSVAIHSLYELPGAFVMIAALLLVGRVFFVRLKHETHK